MTPACASTLQRECRRRFDEAAIQRSPSLSRTWRDSRQRWAGTKKKQHPQPDRQSMMSDAPEVRRSANLPAGEPQPGFITARLRVRSAPDQSARRLVRRVAGPRGQVQGRLTKGQKWHSKPTWRPRSRKQRLWTRRVGGARRGRGRRCIHGEQAAGYDGDLGGVQLLPGIAPDEGGIVTSTAGIKVSSMRQSVAEVLE